MTNPHASKPLSGLKVLELARILAGPWVGQLLADLGADVVKVESPEGDDTRNWDPPSVVTAEGENRSAAYFHACNRGKRSIIADFRSETDLAMVKRLAGKADIVVENFKVGGLAKFGLDAQSLRGALPKLIYCSITGFGQTGPYAERAGYDFLIQGMAGPMSITGQPDGQPTKTGYAMADIFTGMYASVGVLAALHRRDATGEGATLDLALMDSQVAVLGNQAMNYLVTGKSPGRLGNAHPNIVPYEVFPAADGHVIIAVGNDGQYRKLCGVLGAPELGEHADYASNKGRIVNRAALIPLLGAITSKRTRADLLAALEAVAVPAGPINTIADVFADPQVIARGLRQEIDGIPTVASPIVIDGVRQMADRASPRLGGDAEEIRRDWGV
jgi:crotonobetainyl-CoA:carnitine CoA-transferase CaiB-like acyl-CoA transferase